MNPTCAAPAGVQDVHELIFVHGQAGWSHAARSRDIDELQAGCVHEKERDRVAARFDHEQAIPPGGERQGSLEIVGRGAKRVAAMLARRGVHAGCQRAKDQEESQSDDRGARCDGHGSDLQLRFMGLRTQTKGPLPALSTAP